MNLVISVFYSAVLCLHCNHTDHLPDWLLFTLFVYKDDTLFISLSTMLEQNTNSAAGIMLKDKNPTKIHP